ncbi:MAG: hypothetical protein SFY92_05945 [Verrucomicrobiae bacterium]|nr:hypothetical protein [Verrucomicrobiae bacterium]
MKGPKLSIPDGIIVLLFLIMIAIRLPHLGAPLLDYFEFRQTQTALTAYWFAREGVTLPAYPLPVFGSPWTAPMEFPLFQMIMAGVHLMGVPLDMAGRGCAVFFYVASVAMMLWLIRRLGVGPLACVAFVGFATFSPYGIVWSRACLIDYCSVFFSLVYLALALMGREKGWSVGLVLAVILAGGMAGLVKVTTLPVYWAGVVVLAGDHLGEIWKKHGNKWSGRDWGQLAGWILALLVPVLLAMIWTHLADEVKRGAEPTRHLASSALKEWNFGTLQQRLNPFEWHRIFNNISHWVLPWFWPLMLVGLVALRGQTRLSGLVQGSLVLGALGTVCLFFNLHFVHEYYLISISLILWLLAALGLEKMALFIRHPRGRWWLVAVVLTVLAIDSSRSKFVSDACEFPYRSPVLTVAKAVREHLPAGQEIVILGHGWDPSLPYYLERKALMVEPQKVTKAYASAYVKDRKVNHVLSRNSWDKHVHQLWPDARKILEVENHSLHVLDGAGGAPKTTTSP